MKTDTTSISGEFSELFATRGFAGPGVDDLRDCANVSLRTLYKHFPGREAMIIAALSYRNEAYLDWISGGPDEGRAHVLHIFERLGAWFVEGGGTNGCLFLNALAAHPDSEAIRAAVADHKQRVKDEFMRRLAKVAPGSETEDLADALFVIHEGQTKAAMTQDPAVATRSALRLASILLSDAGVRE